MQWQMFVINICTATYDPIAQKLYTQDQLLHDMELFEGTEKKVVVPFHIYYRRKSLSDGDIKSTWCVY